jgi:glycerol-3-phosphate dehydrogenase
MPAPGMPAATDRARLLAGIARAPRVDLAIVGGGATGLGIALDSAARGFSVVLLEAHDFAKGTSSRSTKLLHGGVRYLARGDVGLVREALHERGALLHNAPHLASPLAFVMPAYRWWELPVYGSGLALYDLLAGDRRLGRTQWFGASEAARALPGVRADGLRGAVLYWDGQFDDARLAIAIARTAASRGALLLNHTPVDAVIHDAGRVAGVRARDSLSGHRIEVHARAVINATGVWVDTLRENEAQAAGRPNRPLVAPSQGVHLVVDRAFLPGERALLVPSTADGRVLFAVPWLGRLILGTTDTPRSDSALEPQALADEVGFVLREAARYLARAPGRADVTSLWVGLRPLVRPMSDAAGPTRTLSREHTIELGPTGLVTVTGGKWTTYRAIAEDVLAFCADAGLIERRPGGVTRSMVLAGGDIPPGTAVPVSAPPGAHAYGSDAAALQALPGAGRELAPGLTEAMVRFAARHEWARTTEDMLARRSRLLFLDARAAAAAAPRVAQVLAEETGADADAQAFMALAARYATPPG